MRKILAWASALLLLVALLLWASPSAAQSVTRFGVVSVIRMIVANDITAADITVSDDATVTDLATVGDLTTTDDLAVSDDATVAGDLTDTGTLLLSGNAALGQNDMIVLLSDGTNWIQVAPEGDN